MSPSNTAALLSSAACHDLRSPLPLSCRPCARNDLGRCRRSFVSFARFPIPLSPSTRLPYPSPFSIRAKPFSSSSSSPDHNAPPVEHGVQVRPVPFSASEINAIFGKIKILPDMGNRALAILQGRREAGTLDLDLPADVTRSVRQSGLDKALQWLRENYPLDEDAAILARIEREEVEEEQKLIRRAEDLGLYKPQSGTYEAELGEDNDPSGRSALKEYRKINEARFQEEQERKRQEWLEGEKGHHEDLMQHAEKNKSLQNSDDSTALEARPRADPQQRPVLAWMQKHHLRAMDNEIDISKMSNAGRIIPSLVVTLLALGLCYLFAQNYVAPVKQDRVWPDTPLAAATAVVIIGVNLGIYFLWKVPPAWRTLNRYFILVNAWPRAPSMVGSIFSHQSLKHLAVNMGLLWLIGTRVHDEVGRGNFLALYLASGVLGSFTSLVAHTLILRDLAATSLGASGAMSGLVAAYCIFHTNDKLTFFFLPREWQEKLSAPGWAVLASFVAFETLNLVTRFRAVRLDHFAHLGGYLAGTVSAVAWKTRREKKREEEMTWLDKIFSK